MLRRIQKTPRRLRKGLEAFGNNAEEHLPEKNALRDEKKSKE